MGIVYLKQNNGYAEIETVVPDIGDEVMVINNYAIKPRVPIIGDRIITINLKGKEIGIPINRIVKTVPEGSTILSLS